MSKTPSITIGRRVLETEAEALGRLAAGLDDTFANAVEMLFAAQGFAPFQTAFGLRDALAGRAITLSDGRSVRVLTPKLSRTPWPRSPLDPMLPGKTAVITRASSTPSLAGACMLRGGDSRGTYKTLS